MAVPLQLPAEMEREVRFVEDTAPEEIVSATLTRLREGAVPERLLGAAALAVSRATDLLADHHGGPVHPVAGLFACLETARRLDGDWAMMPLVHNVALANKHIHSPRMGPAIMPEIEARESIAGPDNTAAAFVEAIRLVRPNSAEQFLLALLDRSSPGEILDLMLAQAIRRNPLDDHYFLYPVFAARALDCVGWEWAPVILRKVVRYLATNARALPNLDAPPGGDYVSRNLAAYRAFPEVEALLERYRLLEIDIPERTTEAESVAIGALGEAIGALDRYAEIPEMLARALGDGLSLEGLGEALSIGAGLLFLRTDYGNPFDVHLHTGVNARRYLLGVDGISLRHRILAFIGWATGPEIRLCEAKLAWPARLDDDTFAAMPDPGQAGLLDAIEASITARCGRTYFEAANNTVEQMAGGPEIRHTLELAQQYTRLGYDPQPYFARMAQLTCRDDFSEMHAFKGHQVVIEEYRDTREPWRWVHMVGAAKVAALSHGMTEDVFNAARPHLSL